MSMFKLRKNKTDGFEPKEALSERANSYMSKLPYPRSTNWTCGRETIAHYFTNQAFPLFEKLIAFQVDFSGYTLTIDREEREHDGRHQLDLLLFSEKDIEQQKRIAYLKVGDDYWIDCGQHGVAPFAFSINQRGEIATTAGHELIKVIYSSVEKFIESYAINSAMKYADSRYHSCIETAEIKKFMLQNEFILMEECSDTYAEWYSNGAVTIEHGTKWDSDKRYLHLLAQNKKKCDLWVEKIKPLLT